MTCKHAPAPPPPPQVTHPPVSGSLMILGVLMITPKALKVSCSICMGRVCVGVQVKAKQRVMFVRYHLVCSGRCKKLATPPGS